MSDGEFFVIPMGLDKDGRGPVFAGDIAKTVYDVWDSCCLSWLSCGDRETATKAAALLNALREAFPDRDGWEEVRSRVISVMALTGVAPHAPS